jgi:hypothetical protein
MKKLYDELRETALPTFLGTLMSLAVIDTLFTLFWVVGGHTTEANPVMGLTFRIGPFFFVSIKLLITSGCVGLLWKARSSSWTLFATSFLIDVMLVVCGIHGWMFYKLVFGNI